MVSDMRKPLRYFRPGAQVSRQPSARGSSFFRCFGMLFVLLVLSCGQTQTLRAGLVGLEGGAFGLEPGLVLRDLAVGGLELDFRAAVGRTGNVEFGVGARSKTSFGPVGSLELRGSVQVGTAGAFEGTVAGDGAIASVAARFGLSVFNVNPGRFEPTSAYGYGFGDFGGLDNFASFGSLGLGRPPVAELTGEGQLGEGRWGVFGHLGATYRLSRNAVLELDPSILYVRGGVGVGLGGAAQLRRLRGRDDGAARVLAFFDAGADAGLGGSYGAAGFEYRHNPATGPLLRGSLWLGAGDRGAAPGVRLELLGGGGAGPRYGVELAAEPYRTDLPPYRVEASLQTPAGPGALNLTFLGAAGVPASYPAPRFLIGTFYDVPF